MKTVKHHKIRNFFACLVFFLAGLLGTISLGMAEEEDTTFVDILIMNSDFKFEKASLKNQILVLPVGTELNFMNVDPNITSTGLEGLVAHYLYINDQDGKEIARSKVMNKADQSTFQFRFTRPGFYTYGCFIHFSSMRGKVIAFEVQKTKLPEAR